METDDILFRKLTKSDLEIGKIYKMSHPDSKFPMYIQRISEYFALINLTWAFSHLSLQDSIPIDAISEDWTFEEYKNA